MAREITAKIGTRLTEAEQRKVDKTKLVKLQPKPPSLSVQAQAAEIAVCPNCGCFGYDISPLADHYLLCHCCGVVFIGA